MRGFSRQPLLAAAMLAVLGIACSSATPTGTPGIDRMGQTVLRYQGPEIEAVIGYRFASQNLGEEWLVLDLALTASGDDSVKIQRSRIFVRTPAGEAIYLPSQEEFAAAYAGLRSKIQRAAVAADPLDYFKARIPCELQFFAEPGRGLVFSETWVDDRRVCSGRLFFAIPGAVQPGPYVLGIDLQESKVRIPFRL